MSFGMNNIPSSTRQDCGCMKRRNIISGLALAVAAATLSPLRRLFADAPPQERKSAATKLMGMGSHLLQGKHPLHQIDAYVCGLHFYNGNMDRQIIAHHFCSHRSEEFMQCVIYDSNQPDARLIGIEYIISARLFKSGQLTAPGIPQPIEHEMMNKLVNTYGKTWHTWHTTSTLTSQLGSPS
jgi:hypothetical protein